jgi:hypothetical protein
VGKYGTNLEGFGAFEGGVNADKGAPLVSTSSDGETALLFGPAALREIQAGCANGDFAIPPDAAGDTITAENPLPYWTWTPTALITAAITTDATAGSTNVFKVSLAAASTGETASLTRFISVAASGDRGMSYIPLLRFGATTGSAPTFTLRCRYYKQDLTTATGTEFNKTDTVSAGAIIPDDLQHSTIPSDAAYLKITIEFTGKTLAGTAILQEVRVINGDSYIFLTEDTPTSAGPGQIRFTSTPRRFVFSSAIQAGDISVDDAQVQSLISTTTITSGGLLTASVNATVVGDLTVGATTQLNGANSLWVSRASVASATQSFTNNTGATVLLDTASTSPTTGTYDPKSWFNNTNDRIAIGQAGFYTVTANIAFAANATGRRIVSINVNGTEVTSTTAAATPTGSSILCCTTNLYLAVNDLVTMSALQASGGALSTVVVAGAYPALSVGRIGA